MADIRESLLEDLKQPEFSEGYAESFLDASIATQLKVLREQHDLTQRQLADRLGTHQTVISRLENVSYSAWNITTLKRLARAFRVRLRVSFETYGSLIDEVGRFNRESLKRKPREEDPVLFPQPMGMAKSLLAAPQPRSGASALSQLKGTDPEDQGGKLLSFPGMRGAQQTNSDLRGMATGTAGTI